MEKTTANAERKKMKARGEEKSDVNVSFYGVTSDFLDSIMNELF